MDTSKHILSEIVNLFHHFHHQMAIHYTVHIQNNFILIVNSIKTMPIGKIERKWILNEIHVVLFFFADIFIDFNKTIIHCR